MTYLQSTLKVIQLALPSIIICLSSAAIPVIQQMQAGKLGDDESSALAISHAIFLPTVFFIVGVSTALDTLASQAYGARDFSRVLQHWFESVITLAVLCIPQTIILCLAGPISSYVFLQNERVTNMVVKTCYAFAPDLVLYALGMTLIKVLMAQNLVVWVAIFSTLTFTIQVFLQCVLVSYFGLMGIVIAINIARLVGVILFFGYWVVAQFRFWQDLPESLYEGIKDAKNIVGVKLIGKEVTIQAWKAALKISNLAKYFKLGVAGGLLLSSLQISATIQIQIIAEMGTDYVAAHASVIAIAHAVSNTFPYSIGRVATILVGNNLGSKKPKEAKKVGFITVIISLILTSLCCIPMAILRNEIGYLFTDDPHIVHLISRVILLMVGYNITNSIKSCSQGVLLGIGLQVQLFLYTTLGFFVIGWAVLVVLVYVYGLGLFGVWWSLFAGSLAECVLVFCTQLYIDWEKQEKQLQKNLQSLPDDSLLKVPLL